MKHRDRKADLDAIVHIEARVVGMLKALRALQGTVGTWASVAKAYRDDAASLSAADLTARCQAVLDEARPRMTRLQTLLDVLNGLTKGGAR